MSCTVQAEPVTCLVFSPDGKTLVSNGAGEVVIRSPQDGAVTGSITCDLKKIRSFAFDPSGGWLAVGGGTPDESGEVVLIDWTARRESIRWADFSDVVTSVAFSSDGTQFSAAGADGTARVWAFEPEGKRPGELFRLEGHAGPVLAIAFSPSGRTIATASADGSIKVWSSETGALIRTLSHHTDSVLALAFRPKPAEESLPVYCASGGDDRTVRIWQPEIGRMVRIIRQHHGSVLALAYSPDGKALYSAGREGMIRRLDVNSDAILDEWTAGDDWIYALSVSADGTVASGDWAGRVALWRR